ncbi:MAG: PilZ domain-containing protein [Myxococcota bacterium]
MGRGLYPRDVELGARDGRPEEKRAYLRVAARLRIRERVLQPGEFDALRREIEMRPRPESADIDPRLLIRFERLELKLDRILSCLDSAVPQPIATLEPRDVQVSGAGMCMATKERPEPGARILVEILLSESSVPLRVIGEVLGHIEPRAPGDDPRIAVAFVVINDADREAIVRFALEMERCAVRERARCEEEGP